MSERDSFDPIATWALDDEDRRAIEQAVAATRVSLWAVAARLPADDAIGVSDHVRVGAP
jgi:hypothetical protein